MRAIMVALTLLVATSLVRTASAEILYPWCRHDSDGGTNCGFSTLQQCQGFGKGAFCNQNPQYQSPASTSPPAATTAASKRRR
jgi:hypothetical protein